MRGGGGTHTKNQKNILIIIITHYTHTLYTHIIHTLTYTHYISSHFIFTHHV